MTRVEHLQLMADYNRWMNQQLYAAAATLPPEVLTRDSGAFFGSVQGTLNHVAVGDTLWLKRFAAHPPFAPALQALAQVASPAALDQPLFARFDDLASYRVWLDDLIVAFTQSVHEHALDQRFSYANTKGVVSQRDIHALLVHFFNHQTHHRGQVTTLLHQAGVDPGVTDLLVRIPAEAP